MTVTEYFEEKRQTVQKDAKRLEESWELLKTSLEFIEENETWIISGRMERQYSHERRMEIWEDELKTGTKGKKKQMSFKEETDFGRFWNNWKPAATYLQLRRFLVITRLLTRKFMLRKKTIHTK